MYLLTLAWWLRSGVSGDLQAADAIAAWRIRHPVPQRFWMEPLTNQDRGNPSCLTLAQTTNFQCSFDTAQSLFSPWRLRLLRFVSIHIHTGLFVEEM
jgi:hypothetical protein